jgi:putative membrane protein
MQETDNPTTNELAQQRTVMAAERTFMAWARTSLSLISFGFSIFKFMQYAQEIETKAKLTTSGARNLGTTLVALGVVFLIISSVQHWQLLRRVKPSLRMLNLRAWPLSLFLAALLTLLGLLALVNMIFGVGPF